MSPAPGPYRFHAFDVSYFSAKVRPALRYKRLWYEELRADLGEVRRRTGLGFIPILVTPEDETWQDSSDILDRLEARHPEPPLFPDTPVQRIAAHLVELYIDEFGVIPAMQWRWGTPSREAASRARFSAMLGSEALGRAAADAMVSRRDQVGVTAEVAPALEAHTEDLLAALSAHLRSHAYLLGERMSSADCAGMGLVYGHLFNDLESRRLLLETAVPVVGWIERCNVPNPGSQGAWLADDALAPGFVSVLAAMGRDAAPVICAGLEVAEAALDALPADADPPRSPGVARAQLRGRPLERRALSYTLWMVQRVLDAYRALDPAARAAVDDALRGTGWEPLLAYTPRHRVARSGFRLVRVPDAPSPRAGAQSAGPPPRSTP